MINLINWINHSTEDFLFFLSELGLFALSCWQPHLCNFIMNVSDNQKRWIVFGIALNKILIAEIRAFVEQEIQKEYGNLQTSHSIHTQSYIGRLQRHTVALRYENINGNNSLPRKPGGKYDCSTFDYRVTSYIDFAKLYVENHIAKFNAFDEHCDASALLALLGKVPVFPAVVQTALFSKSRTSWVNFK